MNKMLKENNSNLSATFIESELNYYEFLLRYIDILIIHSKDIYYLQLNNEIYVNRLIISLSLIENIHLHLMTRQLLLQKTSFAMSTNDFSYLRDEYECKAKQLKDLLCPSSEASGSIRDYNSNTISVFPDYSFHDSIKAVFNDLLLTDNPWKKNKD